MLSHFKLTLLLGSLLLAACAPTLHIEQAAQLEPTKAKLQAEQAGRFWWQLRFKLTWPEDEHPDFSRHLLIAEQILVPVLVQHQQQMPLWRFHRRAGRDTTGHQFSLLFYASEDTAQQINEQVLDNPLTGWLVAQRMIEATTFQRRSKEELGRLENTSDASWPMEIQRSWPYFIMGASQSWLTQVQELSAEHAVPQQVDYTALLEHYQSVDEKLSNQWRDHGQHAYLHHLSAIYGYQPIKIKSTTLRTF